MSESRISQSDDFRMGFSFVAYGVRIGFRADNSELLEKGRLLVFKAFGDRAEFLTRPNEAVDRTFGVGFADGHFILTQDGISEPTHINEDGVFRYLNSAMRIAVGESAKDRVFVHAGAVGWNGQAIILPGTSYSGKSSLTAELVHIGAEYYSDEYAVLDNKGMLSPFPRQLSLRSENGTRVKEVALEELKGKQGSKPIPVGMVLFTRFEMGAKWSPTELTPGECIMELLPNTLTTRKDPAFSLKVLDLVVRRAIMFRSPRGDAKDIAKFLLEFFEKNTKLTKIT